VSPLKIQIPSKNMRVNQQIHQLFIQFINYVWLLLRVWAVVWLRPGAWLVGAGRGWVGGAHKKPTPTTSLGDCNVMLKHVGATIRN
jgi:hypothetical protein